jgi:3-isopropylmalate dehydratase
MPSANNKPRTLYDKVFEDHIVDERDDGTILLYIGIGPSLRILEIKLF